MAEDEPTNISLDDMVIVLGIKGGDIFQAKEAIRNLPGLNIEQESGKELLPEEQLTFAVNYLLNSYQDIGIRWSPEQVEELRRKYQDDDAVPQGPRMPSATAMIAPPTELVSQDGIGALVDKAAAEEQTRYVPQEAAKPPEKGDLSQNEIDALLKKGADEESSYDVAPQEAIQLPEKGDLSQSQIDVLLTKTADEKQTRHIPQEAAQQAMGEGDTPKETAEKSSDWENIVDECVNSSVPPKTRYAHAQPKKAAPSSARSIPDYLRGNLSGNLAIQAKLKGRDITRRTRTAHAPRVQTQAQRTYAPQQQDDRLTSSEYDAIVNERFHDLLPGESNSCFAFKTLAFNYKLVHNQDGSISRAKLENALQAFADGFLEHCRLTEAPILCPPAFNKVFGGNARREYIRHFNETMAEYVEQIEPQLRSPT